MKGNSSLWCLVFSHKPKQEERINSVGHTKTTEFCIQCGKIINRGVENGG